MSSLAKPFACTLAVQKPAKHQSCGLRFPLHVNRETLIRKAERFSVAMSMRPAHLRCKLERQPQRDNTVPPIRKDKILILSASTGAGHIRAAEALEAAFDDTRFEGEVRHEDALRYTNAAFRGLYSRTYLDLVNNAPEVLGWLYDYFDSPWKNENHRLAFEALNTGPLMKLLRDYKPNLVISTHFLPADILSWLTCKHRIGSQHAVVLTDLDVHAMWLCLSI